MSKTIDQKVVQMQFDNAGFEQNAKQTMSTLDKLKAALKFDGANKGAEELNKSIKGLDFSQAEIMATRAGFHIQDVFLKISNVLEYQIARKIINIGENIAKSLTLDQVTAGFSEYELKMGSIQTIMAGTGESLEVVNKYLNELNEYSDKTIYSFSDMTQNIGKFTNAGVKLKDAVAAIQGVANVAAVSGANAQEASRAMYNFAQALSAGYVKLIDWKSIENANMATVEFKDTLLQTAAAMGYAKDNGDGYYKILTRNAQGKTMDSAISATKNFNDSLAYQWMKTNVLTQALEIYSKDVRAMTDEEKAAYEAKLKSKGFTDEQIKAFEELGIKATKAASEVKTFSQLMDTIKESIGSGWAMSFEHIIGNFNEAKELFTEVNDEVGVVIGKIDSQRNKMLENWKRQGGREDLIQAFRNLAGALSDLFTPIKQVFDELFGRLDSDKLLSITKGFREWTASLRMNKDEQESFRVTLHYLLVPVKILIESIKIIIGIIPHVISLGVNLIKFLASLVQYIVYVVRNSETFQTVLNGIKVALGTLKAGVIASIKFFKELATTISRYVVAALKDSNSWLNKTIILFKTLGAITLAGLRAAFNSIANFKFSNITDGLEKMKARLTEISKSSKIVQFFLDAFEKLKVGFQVLGDAFGVVIDSLQSRLENVESFGDFLKAVWDSLKDGYNFLKEFIENKFFTEGPGLFDTIKQAFSDFMAVLEGGMDKIPWAKVILIAFTIALASCTINLITAISKFGGLAAALKETVLIINNTIKTFTGLRNRLIELKEIAIFITAITASIAILSLIDKENGNLIKAAATLGILAAGLMILAEAMLWINTKNALAPASLANLFGSIAAIAAGTAILVAAAGALKDMSLSFKEALPYIETLGVLMLGMMGAMTVLTLIGKDKKIFTAGAMSILSYAGAVYILASALNKMAEIEFPNIKDLLKILGEVLLGFTAIIGLSGKFSSWSGFFSIIAFAASMKILAGVLQDLANLNMTEDAQKLVTQIIDLVKFFGVIVATVFTLVKIFGRVDIFTKLLTKNANKLKVGISGFAVNLLAVSASFLIISKAFESFKNNLTSGGDWGALLGLIAIFAAMVAGVAVLFAKISKCETNFRNTSVLLKFGAALLLFDAALVPLSIVLDLLADIVHNHDGGDLAIAATIIGGVGILMGALMWAAGQSSYTDFKVLLSIFGGMSLLLGELIAISVLVESNGDAMLAALGILLITATTMVGVIAGLSEVQKAIGNLNISSLIAVVSSIVVLAGVLTGLTFLVASDAGKNIWEAFGVLGAIAGVMVGTMFVFAGIKKLLGPVGNVVVPLATIVGSMVVLAGVLTGLTFLVNGTGDAIYDALLIMGLIIGGLVGALAILAKITNFGDWATYLGFAAVIVAIAGSLVVMAQVPWDNLARAGIVLIGFVGAMELLFLGMTFIVDGTVGTAALVMAGFAAAIVAITLSFTAFVSVCAKFVNAVKGLVLALIDLGIHGKDIAKGLREVVPEVQNAINKIAQSITDASPKLATAVENIMIGISQGIAAGSSYIAIGIANVVSILTPVVDEALRTLGQLLIDGIKNLILELAMMVLEFNNIGNQMLTAFIGGLLDKFGLGQIAQAGSTWVGTLINTLAPGIGLIFGIGQDTKNAYINGSTPTKGDYDKIVRENHAMGEAAGGAIYTGMAKELKQTKNLANSIPGTVSNAIQKAGNDGSKYAREATTKINNSFYAGWSDQDKMITQLKVKYGSLKNSITGGDGLLGGLKNLVSNGFTAVSDYISDKASPILNEYTKLIEQTTPDLEAAGKAAAGAGDGIEEMGDKAKKGAKGVKEAKDEISSFVEKMEQSFNVLDEFDLGLDEENPLTPDKLLENMRSNITGMAQWSNEMVSLGGKMTQGLYKKLADMGPTGYKYVHAFAQMTEEQLMQVNQLYATSLLIPTNVTTQIYQGMAEAGSNAYTGLVNGMNIPAWQQLGTDAATILLTGMTSQAGLDTHSPSKKTFQIGIYVTEGLSNGMKDPSAKEGLFYTIKSMCVEIITKFRLGLPASDFKDIGQQVLRGLDQGIRSKNPDVLNTASNLCDALERKVRSVLQINSPSKVFAKIGAGIPEGLAKGVTDNLALAENSVGRMANATVDNMRDAISTIQTVVDSDMNVEPVIRPVVDLSNVTNGANTIGSLMDSNFGTNVTMPAASFMTNSELISNTDNSSVVASIDSLKEDIGSLKSAITNIKLVLDSGTMVGAMVEDIDAALGKRMVYAGRGI